MNGNIKFGDRTMTLPKLKTARIKKHREIPKGYILKSATISQESNGNYYVSVLFECEEDEVPLPCGAVAPMEGVSDSRDSSLFPTSKLAVRAIRAHPYAPLPL